MQPAKRNKSDIVPNIKLAPEDRIKEERQVLLKLYYRFNTSVSLWPEIYLLCRQSGLRSKIIYSEYIAKHPVTSFLKAHEPFLLYFEALPPACKSFDLVEIYDEPTPFYTENIKRNKHDVYRVRLY